MIRVLVICLCLVSLVAAAGEPMRPAAKALYIHGMQLYQMGRYAEAATELRAGQAIEPRPEFLYALGQSERNLKNYERATEYYRAFLSTAPPEDQKQLAQAQLERCEQERQAALERATPVPAPTPQVEAPKPAPTPVVAVSEPAPQPSAPSTHWYRDPAGGVLSSLGIVGLVAGAALLGHSGVVLADAHESYQHYEDARGVRAEQVVGAVTISFGVVLLVSGALRYGIVHHHARPASERAP